MAERMSAWLRNRYGERLKADMSLGYVPITVGGDIYKVQVPPLFFGGQVVCLARSVTGQGPVINVLDLVISLPDSVRGMLDATELARIRTSWLRAYSAFEALTKTRNDPSVGSAHTDLDSAVKHLVQDKPEIGLSRWASLQAAEKYLKGWITKSRGSFKKIHELDKIAIAAENLGLPPVNRSLLASIQCTAGVRYAVAGWTSQDAVTAFNAALEVCQLVAKSWPV